MNKLKTIFLLIIFSGYFSATQAQQISHFEINISKDSIFTSKSISETYIVFFFLADDCPFDKVYQSRIENIVKKYPQYKYIYVGDSDKSPNKIPMTKMTQIRFGIVKTPSAILCKNTSTGLRILYKGAIDDNPQLNENVKNTYLENVLKNIPDSYIEKKTVGCKID